MALWTPARYREMHAASVRDIRAFWEPVARREIRWASPFTRVLDWEPPFARWFPDGTLNAAENCVDRHCEAGLGDRPAYYWEGEPGDRRTVTYGDLRRDSGRLAAALARRGFGSGDRAALFLPMIPELPEAMLALARLGIPFTTVFSGFSATALGDRMRDLGATLLITADGSYRRGQVIPLKATADEAVRAAPTVRSTIVVPRVGGPTGPRSPGELAWPELLAESDEIAPAAPHPSGQLLFLLYSSGTTGRPKAIAHGTGGYLVHAAATTRWVFDLAPRDVFWCAADLGWVTGHTYIVFGPLALGATGILYEGAFDHPTPDRLWSMIESYRATVLYTSPTALRSLRKYGDDGPRGHDLSSLRLLGTVGEAINPDVWRWYYDVVGRGQRPIVDTWWQTETGGAMVAPAMGIGLVPLKPGSATFPLPGIEVDVVDEHGRSAAAGEKGFVVVRQPWPGMLLTLLGDDDRYRAVYWTRFPGVYYAGDYGVRDADGYLWFLGRADEVLKVAGHRLGTIEIEDALLENPAVAEAAVCGLPDPVKGDVPVAFVVLRQGRTGTDALANELADHVADRIGKIARPSAVRFVRGLPKTRSGKILRRVVRAVAEGRTDVGDLTTLEDGASVEEIREAAGAFRRDLEKG